MDASNSFFEFAHEYLRNHKDIQEDFEVFSELLDQFHGFLDNRRIQPGLAEWSSTVGFIRSRLKQEIFNLAFSVEKGDEIGARRDPVIQAALRNLAQQSNDSAQP